MTVTTHSGEGDEPTTTEVAAEALDPLVGQTLDGRFRVVDVIGKGAMGKVYRAVQLPLNRAVALKVLDSRYGAGKEESFKQRFLVEAALTSKLSHPNTVRVLDYGSTKDGLFFLAMEYLDGETLDKVLAKGPLPWHRALAIGQQLARALREAHELGVVHRDLKPGNVVLLHADDDTDFAKVLDFGLVKSFVEGHELEGRAITQQGMLMGSPPYMAPEQGEKNRADPRSDIYSLGTMLFEMLSGRPPYTGGAPLEIILKHVNEPIPKLVGPSKFEPVPEVLSAIVRKCLAKSPMDRFQSMDELLLALQDVATPTPQRPRAEESSLTEATVAVTVPPVTGTAPVHVPRRASPLLFVTFALAIAVGVLATWLAVRPGVPGALTVHLESTPAGAQVVIAEQVVGVTPLDLERRLERGQARLELTLRKEGFRDAPLTVSGGGAKVQLSTALVPTAAPVPAPVEPPAPARLEEPQAEKAPVEKPPAKPIVEKKPEPVKAAPKPKVERKKPAAQPAPPPAGPKPASRLEEEETAPAPSELKRPATP